MAVRLRLTRVGKKKQPFYRIVAVDSRKARDGKYIDKIGYYNPLCSPAELAIDEEKANYWLDIGAIPSTTVRNLLSRKGVLLRRDLRKKNYNEERIEEELKRWEVQQIDRERRKQAAEAQKRKALEEVEEATETEKIEKDKIEESTQEIEPKAEMPIEEKTTEESAPEPSKEEKEKDEKTDEKKADSD